MAKYITLTRCAGLHTFDVGQEIEFSEEQAKDLLAANAIRPIDVPVVAEAVQAESKQKSKKSSDKE